MQIEFIGKFFDNHSLSIVNRKLALQLKNLCSLSIVPLDRPDGIYGVNISEVDELLNLSDAKETTPPDVQLRHSYPPIWRWPESNKTKIAYIQPWEFSSIPSEWQYKFDTFADAVITPSAWTANVYKNAGINPETVYTILNGYDETVFTNTLRQASTKIRFIYVGCSQFRKGIDVLLSVWAGVTKKYENIELVIKDTPQVYGKSTLLQDIIKLQHTSQCASIVYNDESLTEQQMAALYSTSDYVIHPYRGEGFGMHIQEAMACGCVPIVTAGGPTDEFALGYSIKSSNRVIDPYEIFALKPGDSMSNMGQHRWVLEPDRHHLAEIIRRAAKEPKPPVNTSKLQTWSQVAELYAATLTQIAKAKEPRRVR